MPSGSTSSRTLPPELILIVIRLSIARTYMNTDSHGRRDYRYFLGRASLVCRDWNRAFRPKLFAELRLATLVDVHFLLQMLRGKEAVSLSRAVTRLELRVDRHAQQRACSLLAGRLPGLQSLTYSPHHVGGSIHSTIRNHPAFVEASFQSVFSKYSCLRHLHFCNVQFHSFSTLVRLLGELQIAEELVFSEVSWTNSQEHDDRPPARLGPFSSIRSVHATGVPASWKFLWLFAPMLRNRCNSPSNDGGLTNSDTMLLMALARNMNAISGGHNLLAIEYDAAFGTLHIWIPPLQLVFAATVQLLAFSPTLPTGKCSAIRGIDLRIGQWDNGVGPAVTWGLVDQLLAEEAVRLEQFTIGAQSYDVDVDLDRVFSPHFPKLCELNKLVTRMTIAPIPKLTRTPSPSSSMSSFENPNPNDVFFWGAQSESTDL